MDLNMAPDPLHIAERFQTEGEPTDVQPHPGGHIHESWRVACRQHGVRRRYLLQRLNPYVFPDSAALMRNIERVLDHIASSSAPGDPPSGSREALSLVAARDGASTATDATGGVWRMFNFIESTRSCETVATAHDAREAGAAFARFQRRLAGLSPSQLSFTIPDFHHTPKRLAALHDAAKKDPVGRAAHARDELAQIARHEALAGLIQQPLDAGVLPLRIAHNDAKIANVLFDADSGEAICVVDLDTVMPGSPLHDFGDMMRSMTSRRREDETDSAEAQLDLALFEALAEGYIREARGFLTAAETARLTTAGRVITFEQAVRFLTDYLSGDVYYRTQRPAQNLDRARSQLALLDLMMRQQREMDAMIDASLRRG
ncbi:MAG: aminoglycoside phosphotransferase family protein [Chloroflexi bacterium]|nr:aminoglycoside phosphotransferase family protein [Chloroflexota bacterium]